MTDQPTLTIEDLQRAAEQMRVQPYRPQPYVLTPAEAEWLVSVGWEEAVRQAAVAIGRTT